MRRAAEALSDAFRTPGTPSPGPFVIREGPGSAGPSVVVTPLDSSVAFPAEPDSLYAYQANISFLIFFLVIPAQGLNTRLRRGCSL